MHEGAWEQEVKSRCRLASGFDLLYAQARVHGDNKPRQTVLITIVTWNSQFRLVNVGIFHLK